MGIEMDLEYLNDLTLNVKINRIYKRTFDILFSSFVIVFLLSWFIPIMGVLIKWESRGPIFFRQKRTGINNNEFDCLKFRSMRVNEVSNTQKTSRNDSRITKIGAFMRKTSIDELPQFINVLLGDMSIVGPRPHMLSETNSFAEQVDKFMVRHFVKPGITGLAQVKGCRGEVETLRDIVKRVKYDIYYIENWSFSFDIFIVLKTILNIFEGEDKAY